MALSSIEKKVNRENLPALYRTATEGSGEAQRNFLFAIFLNILFLTIGSISSAIDLSAIKNPLTETIIATTSSASLLLSIVTTISIEFLKLEKKWYEGRAIAESVKTISWRFMMNTEPYKSAQNADSLFAKHLLSIENERKSFAELLGGETASEAQITDRMRLIKRQNVSTRKEVYLSNRIDGQKKWYAKNSKANQKKGFRFFIATIIFESAALISSVIVIFNPTLLVNPTGILTTALAGLLAWMQVKRYRELAESYGLTTHELGIIESKGNNITTNDQLSEFVLESETAISREHTTWLARRINI